MTSNKDLERSVTSKFINVICRVKREPEKLFLKTRALSVLRLAVNGKTDFALKKNPFTFIAVFDCLAKRKKCQPLKAFEADR